LAIWIHILWATFPKKNIIQQSRESMALIMTPLGFIFMLTSALAANALHLRTKWQPTLCKGLEADNRTECQSSSYRCATGWTLWPEAFAEGATGHCYKRMTGAANWSAAKTKCAELGHIRCEVGADCPSLYSYIAVPNTNVENNWFISSMTPSGAGANGTWLGFDYAHGQMWEDFTTYKEGDWRNLTEVDEFGQAQLTDLQKSWMTKTELEQTQATLKTHLILQSTGNWSFEHTREEKEFICEAAAWQITSDQAAADAATAAKNAAAAHKTAFQAAEDLPASHAR